MTKSVLIFLPNTLDKKTTGYLKGYYIDSEDSEAYYVIDNKVSKFSSQSIGYCGKTTNNLKYFKDESLFINVVSGKITLVNQPLKDHAVVEVTYDYRGFKNSHVVFRDSEQYGKHFKILTDQLRGSSRYDWDNGRKSVLKSSLLFLVILIDLLLKVIGRLKKIVFYSATFLYLEENIINLKWFLNTLLVECKITPKLGNALLAKIIDLTVGIILLHWFIIHEDEIIDILKNTMEEIISNLKGLLLYLMGSPIGLKLNHSFNKSLGQFFFYHISLWRLFLHGIQPLFTSYFRFLVLPGALGFSLQIAMFSDIISIATFHVYCIYVYAARLFSLQLRGLNSLWRLFIGRKYNPLRERVDSCQYTSNQLFIGTLGFTILLFLLPTTMMYYAVFSVFRLIILTVDGMLVRFRYLLNAIPLYVILLWIFQSSSVAGSIYIDWISCEGNGRTKIDAALNLLPLSDSIKKFLPDTVNPIKSYTLGYLVHCTVTGTLI